jgi:hypothetical protein
MHVTGQLHASDRFTPGEIAPGTHWIGGCVSPRAGLDALEKRKTLQRRESNPIYITNIEIDGDGGEKAR